MTATLTDTDLHEDLSHTRSPDRDWQTVVWDDPVNLMSYVARVFRKHFGFSPATAERLMLDVHQNGHAVVAEGMREPMEMHAQAMHAYGLWATVRRRPQ